MNGITGIFDVAHYEFPRDVRSSLRLAAQDSRGAQHRGVMLWAKSTEGVEGRGSEDDTFMRWIDAARNAGYLLGAYHFLNGVHSGKDQADHFVDHTESAVGLAGLVLGCDWEPPSGHSPKAPLDTCREFCARVEERTGARPMFYGYTSELLAEIHDPSDPLGRYDLWQSQFGEMPKRFPPCWEHFTMWQYTNTAQGPRDTTAFPRDTPGLKCDRSYYPGTVDDLAAWHANNRVGT